MDLIEFLKSAEAMGAPVAAVAVYFLWKMERTLATIKASNDVLTDTLLRLVPGFRHAHDEAKKEHAVKSAVTE